ncbi:hypothetical protein MTR_5g054790 [Medicago truncatula]|uniref:Uncharacterized protein n=1 Tax=Medicago truncatula TaxID=3880 RepID=G7JYE3_MEDTR|nr:hypothetical protein MTR_5g054790 [Medicago truncatula]
MVTVAEMYSLGWREEGEAWKWRCRLLAWEEEKVRECCDVLTNIVLQPNHYDSYALVDAACWKMQSTYSSRDFFGKLWCGISHWPSYHRVFPEHVLAHLYQFGTLGGFSKRNRSTFNLIWLSCVRVIWLERNVRVFQQI